MLFIEFEGGSEEELRERFAHVEKALRDDKLVVEMKLGEDRTDMTMLEKVRAISGPILE